VGESTCQSTYKYSGYGACLYRMPEQTELVRGILIVTQFVFWL